MKSNWGSKVVNELAGMEWEGEFGAERTAQLLRTGDDVLNCTLSWYEVRNPAGEVLMIAGVALWSFVRPPELWTMLCTPYTRNLRESLTLTREAIRLPISQYPGLVCETRRTDLAAQSFARKLGFRPSERRSLRPNGELYRQFEVTP